MSETETTVRPALTAEEWAPPYNGGWSGRNPPTGFRHGPNGVRLMGGALHLDQGAAGSGVYTGAERHALAALALHGQPFGFTHEDVRALRSICAALDAEHGWPGGDEDRRVPLIADKLAALLPPAP